MTQRAKIAQALLISIVVLIAIYLVRGFIRRFIVQPLYDVGQYIFRVYSALPQQLLWSLLILAGVWVAIEVVIIVRTPKQPQKERKRYFPSRVENWERWLNLASQGELYRLKLARELGHLTLLTLANREGQSLANIRQSLKNGGILLPEETIKLINSELTGDNEKPILKSFYRFTKSGQQASFDYEIEETVRYLEAQLEVQSGESGH